MAPFAQQAVEEQDLDWWILSMGGVCLYYRSSVLDADTAWLHSRNYEIKTLDTALWSTESAMHADLASTLAFPPYYGSNLNALNDCMLEDLKVPASGGLAIVLNRYDRFANGLGAAQSPETKGVAHAVLDILTRAARSHMLSGNRLIALVQSNDPLISFEGLGGIGARWNSQEWLNKNRGL